MIERLEKHRQRTFSPRQSPREMSHSPGNYPKNRGLRPVRRGSRLRSLRGPPSGLSPRGRPLNRPDTAQWPPEQCGVSDRSERAGPPPTCHRGDRAFAPGCPLWQAVPAANPHAIDDRADFRRPGPAGLDRSGTKAETTMHKKRPLLHESACESQGRFTCERGVGGCASARWSAGPTDVSGETRFVKNCPTDRAGSVVPAPGQCDTEVAFARQVLQQSSPMYAPSGNTQEHIDQLRSSQHSLESQTRESCRHHSEQ